MAEGIFHRVTSFVALGLMGAGLLIAWTGLPEGSTCGMKISTGLPCPGCGMTRSVENTFRGDLLTAWHYNPFGPLFVLACGFVASFALLPGRVREKLVRRLSRFDPLLFTLVVVLLGGLMVHGVARALLVQTGSERYAWWKTAEEKPPTLIRHRDAE